MTTPPFVTPPAVRILMEMRDYSRRAERIKTGGRIMEREELEQMTIKELQAEGKRLGLGVPSRTKKADLIGRIRKQVKADQKEADKMTKVPTKAEIRAKVIAEIEPWDGPESKSPAAFIRAGILSGADQFAIWKRVTIRWPDYRGSGGFASIGTYLRRLTASEHLNENGKPTKTGKELLAELQGDGKDPPEKALPTTTEELIDQVKEILTD